MAKSAAELMSSLDGNRVTPWDTYESFRAEWASGSVPYGHWDRCRDGEWVEPNHVGGSDYSGSLVERSNFDVLLKMAQEVQAEREKEAADQALEPIAGPAVDIRQFYVEVYGGHGTFGLLFHAERTPLDIAEALSALENYPLLDEDAYSQLETGAQDEAWEDWGRSDYRQELEKAFNGEADAVTNADLDAHFYAAVEKANEYWVNEQGGDMYIDLERVVEKGATKPPPGFKSTAEESEGAV